MSEPRFEDAQDPDLVFIEWDEHGPTSVVVSTVWQKTRQSSAVVHQAMAKVSRHLNDKVRPGWRSRLSLENVPLHRLPEFNELIAEARAEEKATSRTEATTVTTRHFASVWSAGRLIDLTGDDEWISGASRQAVSDELLEVLTPPPVEETHTTTARDRLVRFMEG